MVARRRVDSTLRNIENDDVLYIFVSMYLMSIKWSRDWTFYQRGCFSVFGWFVSVWCCLWVGNGFVIIILVIMLCFVHQNWENGWRALACEFVGSKCWKLQNKKLAEHGFRRLAGMGGVSRRWWRWWLTCRNNDCLYYHHLSITIYYVCLSVCIIKLRVPITRLILMCARKRNHFLAH